MAWTTTRQILNRRRNPLKGGAVAPAVIAFLVCFSTLANAAFREPAVLYYGTVTRAGSLLDETSGAVISVRLGSDPVASYLLGDPLREGEVAPNDGAGNAFYLVSLPIENALSPAEPRVPGVLRVGDQPEVLIDGVVSATLLVTAAGKITRLDLDADAGPGGGAGPNADADGDGALDISDNCGGVANPGQTDSNGNGIGDACDCLTVPRPTICFNPSPSFARVDREDVINASDSSGLGAIDYGFEIGSTEVTNAEYQEFLTAVAADDTHSLYDAQMGSDPRGGIERIGAAGAYSYAVRPNMANKPVNFVSWLDAARYTNWLENGKPGGVQDATTTETGAFDLTVANPGQSAVVNPAANWSLPDEDEWHKAAFYDADGLFYWLYPTASDADPIPTGADALGNSFEPGPNAANHASAAEWNGVEGNVISVASSASPSPYGSFDQGGNVAEWVASPAEGPYALRIVRGGSYRSSHITMRATDAAPGAGDRPGAWRDAGYQGADVGFRVIRVLAGDSDEDGLIDDDDNCVLAGNGPDALDRGGNSQLDTDQDGYGNSCDADFNQSGMVDFLDLGVFKTRLFSSDPDADLNGDGLVDFLDLGLLKGLFFRSPGPSGLSCAGTVPCP